MNECELHHCLNWIMANHCEHGDSRPFIRRYIKALFPQVETKYGCLSVDGMPIELGFIETLNPVTFKSIEDMAHAHMRKSLTFTSDLPKGMNATISRNTLTLTDIGKSINLKQSVKGFTMGQWMTLISKVANTVNSAQVFSENKVHEALCNELKTDLARWLFSLVSNIKEGAQLCLDMMEKAGVSVTFNKGLAETAPSSLFVEGTLYISDNLSPITDEEVVRNTTFKGKGTFNRTLSYSGEKAYGTFFYLPVTKLEKCTLGHYYEALSYLTFEYLKCKTGNVSVGGIRLSTGEHSFELKPLVTQEPVLEVDVWMNTAIPQAITALHNNPCTSEEGDRYAEDFGLTMFADNGYGCEYNCIGGLAVPSVALDRPVASHHEWLRFVVTMLVKGAYPELTSSDRQAAVDMYNTLLEGRYGKDAVIPVTVLRLYLERAASELDILPLQVAAHRSSVRVSFPRGDEVINYARLRDIAFRKEQEASKPAPEVSKPSGNVKSENSESSTPSLLIPVIIMFLAFMIALQVGSH